MYKLIFSAFLSLWALSVTAADSPKLCLQPDRLLLEVFQCFDENIFKSCLKSNQDVLEIYQCFDQNLVQMVNAVKSLNYVYDSRKKEPVIQIDVLKLLEQEMTVTKKTFVLSQSFFSQFQKWLGDMDAKAKVEPCQFIETSLYDALSCLDNLKFQIIEENRNLAKNHAALIKQIKEEEANLLLYTLVPIITTLNLPIVDTVVPIITTINLPIVDTVVPILTTTPMFAAETAVILNTPTNVIIPALEAVILAPPPSP